MMQTEPGYKIDIILYIVCQVKNDHKMHFLGKNIPLARTEFSKSSIWIWAIACQYLTLIHPSFFESMDQNYLDSPPAQSVA
jgi:hypothetical protein